ncbi:MAG: hypothetical protein AB7F82_02610 [Alphaproteobacteria bacterium]
MRLRNFTARSMPAAIAMVRQELGENAVIISSEPVNGKAIKVTAAVEEPDDRAFPEPAAIPPAPQKAHKSAAGDLRFKLQNTLRFHNLPELFTAKLMQKISDEELESISGLMEIGNPDGRTRGERMALEKLLAQMFSYQPLRFEDRPTRIMLVGAPGIGKTFTIAKIASRLTMEDKPYAVLTTDNKRAGGIEQLQAYTNILQTELKVATSPRELATELSGIPDTHHILIDTAGCNAYDKKQMEELAQLAAVQGIEPVLVMAAGGDSLEAIDIVEPFAELPIRRMLITRADTARRFGGVLSVAAAYGFSFANISASSSIAEGMKVADSSYLTQLLVQYQLQS